MPRYVALLRGVSPLNCRMSELARALTTAGFTDVVTVLASGNVAFDATSSSERAVEKAAVAAIEKGLGRRFETHVRTSAHLRKLIASDPFAEFRLAAKAKRVVTFLRAVPHASDVPAFPVRKDDAVMLGLRGREMFSAYVPGPKGPVFMTLIEKTFGKDVTTRTWDSVSRCANA